MKEGLREIARIDRGGVGKEENEKRGLKGPGPRDMGLETGGGEEDGRGEDE